MSLYVEWLNKIKSLATNEWLTEGQRDVHSRILRQWQNSPFVCIIGPHGSGKTFIARLLSREPAYVYANNVGSVKDGPYQVVIDGQEYDRLMRPAAILGGWKRTIVLMTHPPKDVIPKVEIVLTERDVRQFQHNLVKYNILTSFKTEVAGVDLGAIIRQEAIIRGGF